MFSIKSTVKRPVLMFLAGLFFGAIAVGFVIFSSENGLDDGRTIVYTDQGFSPQALFIKKGETVRFINRSDTSFWPASDAHPTHSLYPDFDPKESLLPGREWSFTFNEVGPWHYHDHLVAHNLGVVYVFDENETEVDDLCVGTDEEQKYCVVSYLYNLVEDDGPMKAMLALKDLVAEGHQSVRCHQMAHDIGHKTYFHYGTDFAQSEVLVMCSGGFFHGMMEGYLSDRPNVKVAREWCEDNSEFYSEYYSDFESRCAHGVGHGVGETMLSQFDNDPKQFRSLVKEAAIGCDVYRDSHINKTVCISGLLSVVIDWIITTNQQDLYFKSERPFDFCNGLSNEIMEKECVWEFAQRLNTYHEHYGLIFKQIAFYLEASGFYEEYGEWAAMALGQQLGPRYVLRDNDNEVISVCRNESEAVETGCLKGVIEGYILSGVWGEEMIRVEKLCSSELFLSDEQAWCMDWALNQLTFIR